MLQFLKKHFFSHIYYMISKLGCILKLIFFSNLMVQYSTINDEVHLFDIPKYEWFYMIHSEIFKTYHDAATKI